MAWRKCFYRKKRTLILLCCASLFWIVYFLLSLSSPKDKSDIIYENYGGSESRRISMKHVIRQSTKPYVYAAVTVDNKHLVLQEPPNIPHNNEDKSVKNVHVQEVSKTITTKKTLVTSAKEEESNLNNILQIGLHIKNKTLEIGKKMKNKTIEVGEKVKNKTLEHLAVLGIIRQKTPPRFLFEPLRWNLSISFDDIGEIMKDTEFLNKLQPLDLKGPTLSSTKNRTANFTYTMPFHTGYCDCWERYCVCCARISNKRLHLYTTVCSNFTFLSKSQEMDLEIQLNGTLIYKKLISAVDPPLLCLGSHPKVADICIHFFNMTFKVNANHEHKSQLLGCTDFSLNLYNRTIGAHPVDCFQIPGDPNHHHKDMGHVHLLPNWMP
ncbi:uncharacterized protein LOC121381081 isoform X2 [Gigantopelta aegis]|uniref:uncharacterized protein LOC121381081 isoform X2 n=1 Tax=Gigantopelta aegis TaxID=1735272 RepID=UPI001B88B580|nr:uncharacterized protein LOC121381081 isoform X2 [Gigantopelta aegis]